MMNFLAALIALILLTPTATVENKISEWRGKDRTGIYNESNLLKEWPESGLEELWSIDNLGNGFVSPVFTDDNFYITGEIDSMVILYCYDLKGERQWQTTLGKEWMRSYPGSRCAATIVDDLIYVGSGMGNLFCLRRDNGKIVWAKDMIFEFKGALPLHGYSETPVIDGEKIFWIPGGKVNNVVALNRFTGKLIWSNKGFGETSAYNPSNLIRLQERNILVTFSAYHLMGFDTETGELLWSHEQDNYPLAKRLPGYGDTHCNAVLYENGSIYYTAGDGNCGVKLDLSKDGKSIKQIWRNTGFDSYMGGTVKIGNYLYGCGTVKPDLRAIDATSGILTDSLRIGTGAIIAADDMLYYYTQKGDMILLKYDKGKIEKVSSFRIIKGKLQHFSHPVIHKGILYERHGGALMAYDIRKN